MIKFNKETLRDKIYACWIGKNIGGTIGAPYEWAQGINNATGFSSPKGEPIINDDLDLQLVWLKAMEELGPAGINEKVLGEYWLSYITPWWNEYGIGKSNMIAGLVPPLSGEVNNEDWRNSNGAWIRTEIWASLFPAQPDKAIKYSYYDACVDHGYGEGTYAAIFVASIESAAFAISDINELLKIGLSKIPKDCRVARSVNIVIDAYQKGIDWKETYKQLIDDSKDLGVFQAPCNIGFTILGLLYGEGDFKKSVLLAVNCGDDADCTGATCGALFGIMHGTKGIPSDWREYIGDRIASGCLLFGHCSFPKTCTQLTDDIIDLLPVTTHENSFRRDDKTKVIICDVDDFSELNTESFYGSEFAKELGSRKRYSIMAENLLAEALIELDDAPFITPGGTISGKISIKNKEMLKQTYYSIKFHTENGLTVTGNKSIHVPTDSGISHAKAEGTFVINAPEEVSAKSKIVIEICAQGRITPLYATLVIFS